MTSPALPQTRLDAGGTRLRLRALHVMGHGSARIARAVGAHPVTIRKLVRGDARTVSQHLRDTIADLYDAWWDKRAPGRTRFERPGRRPRQPVPRRLRPGQRRLPHRRPGRPGRRGPGQAPRPGPNGVQAREALIAAIEYKNTEFNAQGTELNQRYQSSAVIPEPDAGEETWQRDPGLHLQATTRPGAKIPHVWLVDETGRKVSTLDVTQNGKFTLVTGLSGQAWATAASKLDLPFLRTVIIGAKGTEDLYHNWHRARETDEAGAILVRPDGYVAWRHRAAVWDDEQAFHLVQHAITTVLR